MNWLAFAILTLCFGTQAIARTVKVRGVDFRMQINNGTLDFTTVSDTRRTLSGFGSELSSHIYWLERGRWRSTVSISSRVMSYTSTNILVGETDDLQVFTVAPGLELGYGIFFVQAGYHMMNVNNYVVSTSSKGATYAFSAMSTSAGINIRLGHLGLGLSATRIGASVDAEKLGIPAASQWNETSYSFNLIYYIGVPTKKFFKELLK